MATPFDRLMMTIRPHLPGALDSAIELELFGVCHEFFDLSNTWLEEIEFTCKAGEHLVDVLPTAGKINRLMAVYTGERRPVNGVFMPADNVVRLPYAPPADTVYTGVFAITVSDPVSRDALPIVPFDLAQRYTQELFHGICAKMMLQPQKPYSDIKLAAYHQAAFSGGAARARTQSSVGDTYGAQRWAFPQNFNFRRQ